LPTIEPINNPQPRRIALTSCTIQRKKIMKIAILGTGQVGIALALGFAARGDSVVFGTRDAQGTATLAALAAVPGSTAASFQSAATSADAAVLATPWSGTANALALTGADALAGKLVMDATNPLDFSSGAPKMALGFPESAGGQVQAMLPGAHVVKVFNIISSTRMVKPVFEGGAADMFIAGNHAPAKAQVAAILADFGWRSAIDMGDITQSYLLEAMAMTWISYGAARNHWTHGFSLLGAQA
jgi:8-hydroxy-5-deazaflavin:NADPH oxidoreductase